MYQFLRFLLIFSFLAAPSWAQEVEGEDADAVEKGEPEDIEDQTEVIDETGLDEQGYTDEDDDFRPSEDIPADQSIPFPTDI